MTASLLLRLKNFLIYGGSWTVRQYEVAILDEVKKHIQSADANALSSQLLSLDHVKRLHSDRMVTFYFQGTKMLPRIADIAPELCLARFEVRAGSLKTKASVFAHRGMLSSIEFSSRPTELGTFRFVEMTKLPSKDESIAQQIDQEEHQ